LKRIISLILIFGLLLSLLVFPVGAEKVPALELFDTYFTIGKTMYVILRDWGDNEDYSFRDALDTIFDVKDEETIQYSSDLSSLLPIDRNGNLMIANGNLNAANYIHALNFQCIPSVSGYMRMTYDYISGLCNYLQNRGMDCRLFLIDKQPVEGWFQSDQRGWIIIWDQRQISELSSLGSSLSVYDDGTYKVNVGVTDDLISHFGHHHALANGLGNILYAPFENNDTMISNDNRNYYTDNSKTETNNNTTNNYYQGGDTTTNNIYNHETNEIFDYTNGQWWNVNELLYDASTKTYTANYQTHVGDVVYDCSVHWTYNIDYTSITYLGSSETYDIYNIYYELPDGRSSADLTPEDLEQLNLEFDVINYGLNCDDASLRALYHFDGDTQDSSYWSAYSNFDWSKGASISYLEANEGFEGCLYLDESVHQFTVTLPSSISYNDFSILFRYYQMDTLNNTENTFSVIAGETLASLDHDLLPVGSWMEVGFIRHNGIFRIYVNGIPISAWRNTKVYTNKIRFTFGSAVQCVRYFDELRVFDYAIVENGKDYTPIVQAQTTNLVLTLPNEAKPIPDEYWNLNSAGNLLPNFDMVNDDYADNVLTEGFYPLSLSANGRSYGYLYTASSLVQTEEGLALPITDLTPDRLDELYSHVPSLKVEPFDYFVPVYRESITTKGNSITSLPGVSPDSDYTFSVLLSDGNTYSFTSSQLQDGFETFDWGYLGLHTFSGWEPDSSIDKFEDFRFFYILPKTNITVVYFELVQGDQANSGHEKVTVMYDPLDLDGPTIAIRSQIPVNTWKLGGVRPTIPERGDVWCGIQNSSIYSSQIYNGFAWIECEIRIWTDKERWVSAAYYNILTQQDFYDINGTTDKEHLQTSQGFYTWFQAQWKQLLEILQTIDNRIEKLRTNSASNVELNFNIDGTIDVTFSKLADDGRSGILKIVYTFWELIFVDVWNGAGDILDDMAAVYGRDQTNFTIGDESGWTVWSIISADQEDLWE